MINFKEWLEERKKLRNEVATSTSCVATFARRWPWMVERGKLGPWGEKDPFFSKKKKKRIND